LRVIDKSLFRFVSTLEEDFDCGCTIAFLHPQTVEHVAEIEGVGVAVEPTNREVTKIIEAQRIDRPVLGLARRCGRRGVVVT
jgi:hypothetical protein